MTDRTDGRGGAAAEGVVAEIGGLHDGWVEPLAPRVLVVEDDRAVRDGVGVALAREGYRVAAEPNGLRVADVLATFCPDLVILDVFLGAGPDGFDVARAMRSASRAPLLVFLTAADSRAERLIGYDLGADEYLVKPFAMPELLARVHVVLRRGGRETSARLQIQDLVVDDHDKTVARAGRPIALTGTEYEVLRALVRARGRAVSKVQLLAQVWGFEDYDPNLVEVHVSSLRRKLEEHGPRLIHTERGRGYVARA